MKTFLLLLAGAACWLGGYYCGRLPGSPDIFGWASTQYRNFEQAGGVDAVHGALQSAGRGASALFGPAAPPPAGEAQHGGTRDVNAHSQDSLGGCSSVPGAHRAGAAAG